MAELICRILVPFERSPSSEFFNQPKYSRSGELGPVGNFMEPEWLVCLANTVNDGQTAREDALRSNGIGTQDGWVSFSGLH